MNKECRDGSPAAGPVGRCSGSIGVRRRKSASLARKESGSIRPRDSVCAARVRLRVGARGTASCCFVMAAAPGQEPGADASWINADLLREVLADGATILKMDVERAVPIGENFFSVLCRARVEFRTAESDEVHVRSFIVKSTPYGEYIQQFVRETCAFEKETSMYEDVLPRLYAFADEKLGKYSFNRISAKYYKCSRLDTLIFEDLRASGYKMVPKKNRLNLAHSKLVMQNLARFHALSTAYTEQHPDYILQFQDKMFSEENRQRMLQVFLRLFKIFAEQCKKWKGFEHITNKFDAMETKYIDKLIDVCKVVDGGRNVLAHGDCWINNLMFKYACGNEPVDLRFVDFQLSRASSPAIDLNYFLFTSPDIDVRVNHLEDLLQEYCDEFGRSAKALGYSGPLITLQEIRAEVDRTALLGFTGAISTMAVVLTDPEDAIDVNTLKEEQAQEKREENGTKVYSSAVFHDAFEFMLPYFDERGVFD